MSVEINTIYKEPCLETIARFDDNSIDAVVGSPPYWMKRDYGYEGQWGMEPTFHLYLDHLWEMMFALMPKLKKTGTAWINLGDTYSTQSNNTRGVNYDSANPAFNPSSGDTLLKGKLKPKCLLMLPHRFAIGCSDMGWILRNDIIWGKRNGMPESAVDRFSSKHEYFFFMTKSLKYYFDLDSIREKHSSITMNRYKYNFTGQEGGSSDNFKGARLSKSRKGTSYADARLNYTDEKSTEGNINGKNPGTVSDFWDIPTKPTKHNHYASYNEELLKYPVLSGCPEGGLIYDPFMGSGTTAVMCLKNNRNYVGSEMSQEYINIANKNIAVIENQDKLFAEPRIEAVQQSIRLT